MSENEALQARQAMNRTLDIAIGAFDGGVGGARGASVLGNLTGAIILSGILNGLHTAISGQRFFSKETLVSTSILTGASFVTHLIAKGGSDSRLRHHASPRFNFSSNSCSSTPSSWAGRVHENAHEQNLQR